MSQLLAKLKSRTEILLKGVKLSDYKELSRKPCVEGGQNMVKVVCCVSLRGPAKYQGGKRNCI